MSKPKVRYRTIHGHRRAFRMAGSGPAVLLLHGIGDSSESWVDVMDDLARDHTVIAPDLLGHGESAKPRADYSVAAYANGMRDLLEVLDIDRVTVVGHSLGGGVAAQFAYQYPERCERLVLVATGGVARDVTVLLRVASLPLAEVFLLPLRFLPRGITGPVLLEGLRLLGNDIARDRDEFRKVFSRLHDDEARVAFSRTLRSVVDWRGQVVTLRDRCYLAEAIPTLVVWGARDGVIPASHASLLKAAMPDARLEVFEEAGHAPHHADLGRFLALLRDFLATTEPAEHDPERWQRLLSRGRPACPDDAVILANARAEAQARAKALAEAGDPAGDEADDLLAELLDPIDARPPLAASGN
jgi:pimeloyl-ACP methyl ester carboxylesterase